MTVTPSATLADYRHDLAAKLHDTTTNRIWCNSITAAHTASVALAEELRNIHASFDETVADQLISAVAVINPNAGQHVAGDIHELADQLATICSEPAFHSAETHDQLTGTIVTWLRTL